MLPEHNQNTSIVSELHQRHAALLHWFANSVVCNADGTPRRVFHGTSRDFTAFDDRHLGRNVPGQPTTRMGHYFTELAEGATRWAQYRRSPDTLNGSGAPQVLPVYLRLENPFHVQANSFLYLLRRARASTVDRLVDQARSAGHDGFVIDYAPQSSGLASATAHSERWYCVFHPTQVKSAIGNRGTFDPADDNMLFCRRNGRGSGMSAGSTATANDESGSSPALSTAALRLLAQRVRKDHPNSPPIRIVTSLSEAPNDLRDRILSEGGMESVEGCLYRNRVIYLFAWNLRDLQQAEHVLAQHEIAHAGLASLLGARRAEHLQRLARLNPSLHNAARKLQRNSTVDFPAAVEEVLVDLPPASLLQLQGFERFVQALADGLRWFGLPRAAATLDQWLDRKLPQGELGAHLTAQIVTSARWFMRGRRGAADRMSSALARMEYHLSSARTAMSVPGLDAATCGLKCATGHAMAASATSARFSLRPQPPVEREHDWLGEALAQTGPIDWADAAALVAGKTRLGGVDPLLFLQNRGRNHVRCGLVDLDAVRSNECDDRYDGTVNRDLATHYKAMAAQDAPPVILRPSRRDPCLNVIDGGHRISAARLRGDRCVKALVLMSERQADLLSTPSRFPPAPAAELRAAQPLAGAPSPHTTTLLMADCFSSNASLTAHRHESTSARVTLIDRELGATTCRSQVRGAASKILHITSVHWGDALSQTQTAAVEREAPSKRHRPRFAA